HIEHRAELNRVAVADKAERAEKQRAPAKKGAAARSGNDDVATKGRELFKTIARNDDTDAEAAARVANLNITEAASEAETANSLQVDPTALALLAARMEVDVAAVSERF